MRWRVPMSRTRKAALLGLIAVIAVGLGTWKVFFSPQWVWRRAVHGVNREAEDAAWQQLQKGQIAGMTPEESEAELIEALEDSHFMVRFRAVGAIRFSDRGPSESIPLLIPCVEDDDYRVRRAAVAAIGSKVEKGGQGRDLAEPALRTALADENAEVRRQAVDAVGSVVTKARRIDDPLIATIASKLKDSDEHVAIQAAFELVRLDRGDEALPILKAYVNEHREMTSQAATSASVERALIALSKLAERSDDAIDFLLADVYRKGEPLENPSLIAIQLTAMTSQKGLDRLVARMRAVLKGGDPDRRIAAALVLDTIGHAQESVPVWIEALHSSDNRDIRLHAVTALTNLRPPDPMALAALREATHDADLEVGKYAAEGLDLLKKIETRSAGTP